MNLLGKSIISSTAKFDTLVTSDILKSIIYNLINNCKNMQVSTRVVILKQEDKTFEYGGKKNDVVILTVFQQHGNDNAAYSVVAPKGTKFPPYTEVDMIADVKPGIFGKNPVLKFTSESIKIVK